MSTHLYDLGTIHEYIKRVCFNDKTSVWIYNGSAVWVNNSRVVYVCRARDDKGGCRTSHVAYVEYSTVIGEREKSSRRSALPTDWVVTMEPRLLLIPQTTTSNDEDCGPQDARPFVFRDEVYVIFNMIGGGGIRNMYLFNTVTSVMTKLPALKVTEKNWTPFERNGQLQFIYSFVPLVIIGISFPFANKVVECHVLHRDVDGTTQLDYRGGSPALEIRPNVYEGYLHSTIPINVDTKRDILPYPARNTNVEYLTHRFELFMDPDEMGPKPYIKIGPPVKYFDKQIELVYAMNPFDGDIVVNVNDESTVIIVRSV